MRQVVSAILNKLRYKRNHPRVIALLATYNEERFIAACLEHLIRQGIEVYLIDNESTDSTISIAKHYLGHGLIGIETLARLGMFRLRTQLERKEELAATLDADWFMHCDADEIRLPPRADWMLAHAFSRVDREGFNAVDFMEFTFFPTRESPDHDHPRFQETMRWYHPLLPFVPYRVTAWKRQPHRVELAWSGGHQVRFPGIRTYPQLFKFRHYMILSKAHAIEKYAYRIFDSTEVAVGWHGPRAKLQNENAKAHPELLGLPSQSELRYYVSDDELDPSNPWSTSLWLKQWAARVSGELSLDKMT
ncbi:glycosyltransferase family 2 protein [Candidatus Acetothermia bacterium]|nr:glycosyltransferase family 2 protein [Candidatus Acetothermia bacterium]